MSKKANVSIEQRTLNRIIKQLDRIEKNGGEPARQLITESEILNLFGWSKKTIQNYISNETIPRHMYTVGIAGTRFYDKAMLMGGIRF